MSSGTAGTSARPTTASTGQGSSLHANGVQLPGKPGPTQAGMLMWRVCQGRRAAVPVLRRRAGGMGVMADVLWLRGVWGLWLWGCGAVWIQGSAGRDPARHEAWGACWLRCAAPHDPGTLQDVIFF